MNDKTVAELAMFRNLKKAELQIYTAQCSSIDRENGLLTSYDVCMIQQKAKPPTIINDNFTLQIYTSKEIKEVLNRNGFEILNQYDMKGLDFLEDKSLSILTVARKK
jgi:hypothetical protein